jgi:hypothetical protein
LLDRESDARGRLPVRIDPVYAVHHRAVLRGNRCACLTAP